MLLRRVVSTPGGQKKSYLCLYLSLLYLVRVVNTPAPLGSPHLTPPHPSRQPRHAPHMPTLFLLHLHRFAPLVHRASHAARCRYHLRAAVRCTIYYSTPIATTLQAWLGG